MQYIGGFHQVEPINHHYQHVASASRFRPYAHMNHDSSCEATWCLRTYLDLQFGCNTLEVNKSLCHLGLFPKDTCTLFDTVSTRMFTSLSYGGDERRECRQSPPQGVAIMERPPQLRRGSSGFRHSARTGSQLPTRYAPTQRRKVLCVLQMINHQI